MGKTKIEWADKVWNPVVGCTPVSAGCANCYAKPIYERFHPGQQFSKVNCIYGRLDQPLHWRKPARIFVNSMSDLFHDDVPLEFILRVWMVMAQAKQHTFIILTKRPERMKLFVNEWLPPAWGLATTSLRLLNDPLPNVWLGVSVENQKTANERIPLLLQTPAALRLLSVEPMLGNINLFCLNDGSWADKEGANCYDALIGYAYWSNGDTGIHGPKIDWVICGGETGTNARKMEIVWASSLKDQCEATNTPFFFKSWGDCHKDWESRIGGLEYHQFPEAFL